MRQLSVQTFVINAKGLIHRNLLFFVPIVKPQKPLPRFPNPQSPGHSQNELPTPVKVDILSFFLSRYTPFIAEHLVSGFTLGFSIHHEGQRISSHSQNLMSALHNLDVVDLKIEKELLGPFEMPPFLHSGCHHWVSSQRRHPARVDSYTSCFILRVPQSMTVFLLSFLVSAI